MAKGISAQARLGWVLGAGLVLALTLAVPGAAQDQTTPALRESIGTMPPETVVVRAPHQENHDYRLGPGDKLRVTVFEEGDLSGEFQIDSSGFVRLPMIGDVRAAGLTAHELEAQVKTALDDGYLRDARVAIEVTDYRPFFIIGQVNRPGQYPYVSNMSALNAIALAGGFTEKAVESSIYVRHEGEMDEHAVSPDELTQIAPGDVIRVRETAFWSVADIVSPLTGIGYVVAQLSTP